MCELCYDIRVRILSWIVVGLSTSSTDPRGVPRFHKVSKESWEWNSHQLLLYYYCLRRVTCLGLWLCVSTAQCIQISAAVSESICWFGKGHTVQHFWANKTCSIRKSKDWYKWDWIRCCCQKAAFFNPIPSAALLTQAKTKSIGKLFSQFHEMAI